MQNKLMEMELKGQILSLIAITLQSQNTFSQILQ